VTIREPGVRVVLVRPRNPLNIGAAARAMRNFGFDDLAVVAPYEPVWQEAKSAVGAEAVLRRARAFPDLPAAIEDCTLVIGTSSLSRRQVAETVVSLDRLPVAMPKVRQGTRLALVFGSEKTGLSNDDLSRCHFVARIPTSAACPSMNLGQAVAVCCYELRRTLSAKRRVKNEEAPRASVGEIERLVDEIEKLRKANPGASGSAKVQKIRLRRMFLRWPVTSREVTLALGVLRDISWRLEHNS